MFRVAGRPLHRTWILSVLALSALQAVAAEHDNGTTNPEREGARAPIHSPGVAKGKDPDLPAHTTAIDKDLYLRKRDEYIMLRRGLPFPPGEPNPRVLAIRQMQAEQLRQFGFHVQSQFLPGNRQALQNSTSWAPVGPAPIPNGQTNGTSVAVSGRVTAIAVNPTNANTVYVGTADGGLYRSLDGGSTWTALMDAAQTLSIGAIAIDPLNSSTILVGTGDGYDFFGVGVYMITNADGVAPTLTGPFGGSAFDQIAITKVLISPTDDNIVFVSTTYGGAGRDFAVPTTAPSRGLFRSTNFMSGSPTFTKLPITTANSGNRRVTDMMFDPSDPNNLIVNVGGLLNVNGVADGGLYRVTSALGATPAYTQTLNLDNLTNVKFAVNKVGTTVTMLAATAEPNTCTSNAGALRRSTDGGQTWSGPLTAITLGGFCGTQCGYDLPAANDPTTPNTISVGGSGEHTTSVGCPSSTQLLSTDGGNTFKRAENGLHADTQAIAFAPSNPLIVYAGDDGGIFKSTDGGGTWSTLNNSGFSATQFNAITSHPLDRYFALGGSQDNGADMIKSDGTWTLSDSGDGGYAAIDRNASDTYPLFMYHTYYNITNSFIGFGRVSDLADALGQNWTPYGSTAGYNNGIGNDPTVLFFAPMVLGAGNPSALYFGTDRLYRSTDSGITMSVVSQAPLATNQAMSSIAVSPQDDHVRIVGLQNGKVFATTTGSATMTDVTGSMPANFVGQVAIDPNNENVAYATFSGYGLAAGQHVWKNSNLAGGGANWLASGTGIPDVPVDALVIDPLNSNNLYAGSDIGVYSSTDGGNSWNPFGAGLPYVAVFDLNIQSPSRVLRAATHGRGVWEILIPGSAYPALSIGTITASPTSGNGNAYLEPGESGSITMQVINHGIVTATGVTATISTSSSGVTLDNTTSTFPNIAAGASATNSVPFTFDVAQTATCGGALNFTIALSASGAPTLTQPYRLVLGGPAASSPTFPYTGTAAAIPDNTISGVLVPLAVSGMTAPIAKVTLTIGGSSCNTTAGSTTVGIDHTSVAQLQITLISPSGTSVPLTLNSGGFGTNLCNTVFADSATTTFSSTTASQNPYTGTFRPISPLSTFAGETANGTWQLKVVDGYPGDTGNVRAFSITITPAACAAVLAAPQNLQATAASTSSVNVTWSAVTGADHYELYRSSNNAAFALVASPTSNSFSDFGLAATTTYLYKVRAVSATIGTSEYTPIDPATTIIFTDSPLVAGVTAIKAVHLTELREAVNAMRAAVGLAAASFTDPTLSSSIVIKAIHISELRTALSAARTTMRLTTVYNDDPLVAGSTIIKAVHIQEIRDATQ